MSQPLFFIRADDTLEQAEKIFHEYKLTTCPVLQDKKKVMGILTDFQLLKCFLIKNSEPNKIRVKDYAAKLDPVVLIDENEPISNAFKLMIQSPNHRIYATNEGILTGALSPKDILPFLAGDEAVERHREDQDLITARIRIKLLMTELMNTQANLDRYQQVFTSSPFMIHSVNMQGTITMANRMLHYVLGYEDGELVGKSLMDLYPSQYHKEAKAGLTRVKITGFHPLINTLMVKKNKELLQVDIATAAKIDQLGVVVGTVTIGRISDSAKMLEALAEAAAKLRDHDFTT